MLIFAHLNKRTERNLSVIWTQFVPDKRKDIHCQMLLPACSPSSMSKTKLVWTKQETCSLHKGLTGVDNDSLPQLFQEHQNACIIQKTCGLRICQKMLFPFSNKKPKETQDSEWPRKEMTELHSPVSSIWENNASRATLLNPRPLRSPPHNSTMRTTTNATSAKLEWLNDRENPPRRLSSFSVTQSFRWTSDHSWCTVTGICKRAMTYRTLHVWKLLSPDKWTRTYVWKHQLCKHRTRSDSPLPRTPRGATGARETEERSSSPVIPE